MKVLVMACHADDEILGAGGVICKYIEEGNEVHVCVVTKASEPEWNDEFRENKLREQKEVDTFLGITKRHFLNHSVLELNKIGRARFNHSIQEIVNEIDPDVIYTHYEHDLNYQHQLVSLGTIIAVRPPKKITVYMYETESSRFGRIPILPSVYVDIGNYMDLKCQAFSFYESEIRDYPHPRSIEGIINHAKYRGNEVGLMFAEAFYLVRCIVK